MRRRDFVTGLLFAATTLRAQAQQTGKVHRIAVVHPSSPVTVFTKSEGMHRYWRVFFEELERQGHVEGRNLIVERYTGEGKTERYAELAREVVWTKPDLVFTFTSRLMVYFKAATTSIPIVGSTTDPVLHGLATSLARPGGNITGVVGDVGFEIWGKRVELLRQAVPQASRIAFLTTRRTWEGTDIPAYMRALREVAERAGIKLLGAPVDDPLGEAQFRRAFAAMAEERADAFLASDGPEFFTNRHLIVDLATKNWLPAIYAYREYVEIGGLMAYAYDLAELFRHLAVQVSQILNGANPAEIPFYQSRKFELIINLKAAESLGLTFPPMLLAFASEVIE